MSGFDQLGEREGFVCVRPRGVGVFWAYGLGLRCGLWFLFVGVTKVMNGSSDLSLERSKTGSFFTFCYSCSYFH